MSSIAGEFIFIYDKSIRRWLFSFLTISCIYFIVGLSIWRWKPDVPSTEQITAAIMVEYAPTLTVAKTEEKNLPAGPEQKESPPPEQVIEPQESQFPLPKSPVIEKSIAQVDVGSKPKPAKVEPVISPEPTQRDTDTRQREQHEASLPPADFQTGNKSAAPVAGTPTEVRPFDPSIWLSRIHQHLDRHKRLLPWRARHHRLEGVVYVRFTVDKSGKLLSKSLEQGSKYTILDKEALELIVRSQPFPPPPPEIPGNIIEISIPIEFSVY